MDAARKKAYRHLLSRAFTRSRALLSIPEGHCEERHRGDCAYLIADLMHNLAHYSALEFEGFDEARYWDRAAEVAAFDVVLAWFGNRDGFERSVAEVELNDPVLRAATECRPLLRLPDDWRRTASRDDTLH